MSFRHILLSLAFSLPLAATPALAAKPDPTAELEVEVVGDLEVGPDGAVRSYAVTSELAPVFADIVAREVKKWTFEPIEVDGKPVIAETRARLSLRAIPHAGDYQLRIENVSFGDATPRGERVAPKYPGDALREGIGAKVLLVVRLDADGGVIAAEPYQTSLDAEVRSERAAKRWRERFEQASVAAAKQWHYDVTETVGGVAGEQVFMVPISYTLSYSRTTPKAQWRQYFPGPITPSPLQLEGARMAAQAGAAADGETRALASRFRLKNDVTGSYL